MRVVARRFHVALATVQLWVQRAVGQRPDRVDWSDRPAGCHYPVNRTAADLEERVLQLRRTLKEDSDLGEFGAAAIARAWAAGAGPAAPSLRTIGRILERRGALDGRRRVRRPAPPPGWYLPPVAGAAAELDSFDTVEGLVIRGGPELEILNGISLHGALPVSWPSLGITAKITVDRLIEHWRRFGRPGYAQFDNDTRFQGTHRQPGAIGRVARLCLSLGVVPVFVPPREHGFQAAIENYNGRWQAKVWARFSHASLDGLCEQSERFVTALRQRSAARIEAAPRRRAFPVRWKLDLQGALRGRIIFLRRSDDGGRVNVLGHTFAVATTWPHRLVRAELNLTTARIAFYGLRRRDPAQQPLLHTADYPLPLYPFHE